MAAQTGNGRRVGHSEECRQRFEGLMSSDKRDRVKQRIDQWVGEQAPEEVTESQKKHDDEEKDSGMAVEPSAAEEQRTEAQVIEPEVQLEDGPGGTPGKRGRFRTPERAPA